MYTVYVHISPSNKLYIGITKENVYNRWDNGNGYSKQPYFYNAIQKYGWDNIKHIVLLENLSKEMACECEKYLIAKYQTNNSEYGYNLTGGGDGLFNYKHSQETKNKIGKSNSVKTRSPKVRKQISDSVKKLWQDSNYATNAREKLKQANSKLEHRQKISKALKGRHLSSECKQKLSDSLKGREVTSKTRYKISEAVKLQHQKEKELGIKRNYNNDGSKTRNKKWYNNGIKNIRCYEKDKPEGFVEGRLKNANIIDRPKKKVVEKEDVF